MKKLPKKFYEEEILRLQTELVKMQNWVIQEGLKIVIIFEGRDGAGKGGTIKRLTEYLNPRHVNLVALPAPNDREKTQWYFQRYVQHLPAAGEITIFDRSWYNRAGVEKVMGFCNESEYTEFMRSCPEFEHMLVRSGVKLVKYWFSVSSKEQEKRFESRLHDPLKQWKLSPMDLFARSKWHEYSKAKDEMLRYTHTHHAPWYIVESDSKKKARLNCISHFLDLIDYQATPHETLALPALQADSGYDRPPIESQPLIDDKYSKFK